MFKGMTWQRTVLLLGIVLTMLIALLVRYAMQRSFNEGTTTTSGKALIGGPFELVDHTGATRTAADFRGQHMLIYFGFTLCPDICPTELAKVAAAIDMPPENANVTPVFITIDPERDGVEEVRSYAKAFHPRMVGLTGTPERIAQAAKAYRVYYAKNTSSDSTEYLMDHSSIIYFMDPAGDYLDHFTME